MICLFRQDQIDLLGEEDALRSLFAEERFIFTSEVHYNRYLACESVWDNIDKFHYAEETKEEVIALLFHYFSN